LRAPAPPRAAAPAEQPAPAQPAAAPSPAAPSPPPLRAVRAPEVKSPRSDAKPASTGKTLYDSLEQEMASLLGRPTAKN
jgi:flagellar protein FliO/FliZ